MKRQLQPSPFVGRTSELGSLRSVLDEAARGAGQVVLIEGEAGIGKTRLVDEALAYAESKEMGIFRAAADEFEVDRPFGVVADALGLDPRPKNQELAELGSLLSPSVGSSGQSTGGQAVDLGFRIVESIVSLIEELAENGPCVLALEDLHWADPSTLRTIRFLARSVPTLSFALLLTLRPHPRFPELDRLIERIISYGGVNLVLRPLEESEASNLASLILAADLGPRLQRQIVGAGGNPLFVSELIKTLDEEKALDIQEGRAEVTKISLPPSLRLTLVRRLSFLREETLEILKIASVLGSSFSVGDLSIVTERSATELLSHVTHAVRAGILVDAEDRLSFKHDLIRDAVYEDIPFAARKELHSHVGRSLAARNAPIARVATHFSLGASHGDREAIGWLHRAALEAAPRSAPVAVELLERALELVDRQAPERPRLSTDLVVSLISVGRLTDAVTLVREVLEQEKDRSVILHLRRSLAIALFWGGDRVTANELLAENLAAKDPASDPSIDLAFSGAVRLYQGDLAGARALAEQALSTGEKTGNEVALITAHGTLGSLERFRGSVASAVRHASLAVEMARRTEDPLQTFNLSPSYFRGAALIEADRLDESGDEFRSGRGNTEARGAAWQLPFLDLGLAINNFLAGRWDDAIAEAEGGLTLVEESESTFATVISLNSFLAAIAFHRGDLDRAESHIGAAQAELARSGPQIGVDTMLWVRALLLEARKDLEKAVETLGQMWSMGSAFGFSLVHRLAGVDLVQMALELGEKQPAEQVTADLEGLAELAGVPTAQGAALLCRGLLENDVETLLESVEAYNQGPRPFDRAFAHEVAATKLAEIGRQSDATSLFNLALETYSALEARWDSDRLAAVRRRFGIRGGRRPSPRRALSGWESLTETELRVVRLVAEGLTNKQIGERLFISRRTAETHVGHALRKLQLTTRVELAAAAVRNLTSS